MTDYIERVRAIRRAAKIRFPGAELKFAHIKKSSHPQFLGDDPLSWRLDMWEDGANSHALFNLRTDYTEETIKRKFESMEVSRKEFLGTF